MDHRIPTTCLACRRNRGWTRICTNCQARTDEALEALPAWYDRLGEVLIPGSIRTDRVSGSRSAPLPATLEPLTLRAAGGIVGYLTDWEDSWRQELGWSPRPFRGSIIRTIAGSVQFLRHNWPWAVGEHPIPEYFVAEIDVLLRQCRLQIEGPSDYKPVGSCPTVCDDGLPCATTLWANPWLDSIRCRGCNTTWPREHWLLLGGTLRQEAAAC